MNFIRELPSLTWGLDTSKKDKSYREPLDTHHSTFSHYHLRLPESSAGAIHIKYTRNRSDQEHESTHHTAFKSD